MGLGFVMVRCAGCGSVSSVPIAHWKHGSVCDLNGCKGELKRQQRLEYQIQANLDGSRQTDLQQPTAPRPTAKVFVIGEPLEVYESKSDALDEIGKVLAREADTVIDPDIRWAVKESLSKGEIERALRLFSKSDKKNPPPPLRFEMHDVRPDSQRKENS